jgi:hypothetical protein
MRRKNERRKEEEGIAGMMILSYRCVCAHSSLAVGLGRSNTGKCV